MDIGFAAGTSGRQALTGPRTYYVRKDGSNSNNGLTNSAAGAFLTINYALSQIKQIDFNGYVVTLQGGDAGTVTYAERVIVPAMVGITGSEGLVLSFPPTTTIASPGTYQGTIECNSGAKCTVTGGFTIGGAGAGCNGLNAAEGATITVSGTGPNGYAVVFGPVGAAQLYSNNCGTINVFTPVAISGGGECFARVEYGGNIFYDSVAITTITTAVTYSVAFLAGFSGGSILLKGGGSGLFVNKGNVTATRYITQLAAGIQTFGQNQSVILPGATAGTATAPGWYN